MRRYVCCCRPSKASRSNVYCVLLSQGVLAKFTSGQTKSMIGDVVINSKELLGTKESEDPAMSGSGGARPGSMQSFC